MGGVRRKLFPSIYRNIIESLYRKNNKIYQDKFVMANQEILEKMKDVQRKLKEKVVLDDEFSNLEKIAGVDQSFNKDKIYSGIVILNNSLDILEREFTKVEVKFPYKPGLLAFREAYPIFKVWQKIDEKPDILFVDGHGIVHPRKFGLASHVGVVLDIPTIGIAKNKLVGSFGEPKFIGEFRDLKLNNESVGKVLKSKDNCNPIFISPGHKVSLESSLRIARKYLENHKLPEPLYKAHRYVNKIKGSLK